MLSPAIIRNIKFLDWVFITIHGALALSLGDQGLPLPNILIYALFFGLSFYSPQGHSSWRRRCYVGSGVLLAIAANFINVPTDFLLYLYIGKSCFLLRRRETLVWVILTGLCWVFSDLYSAASEGGELIFEPPYGLINNNVFAILSASLGVYLGTSIFVLLFGFTIVAEQKSRKQAEDLVQQVEALTKALERARIARDIHDSLGHTLTNLDIQLQLAQRLRQADLDQAFQAIDLAKTLSSQCIEDVSYALAPIRQSDFDFNQAIEHLINQLRRNTPISAKVEMALPSLPLQTRHQVYFILKECLINVQKHAKASQVHLRGHVNASRLWLDIEDDGVGFIFDRLPTGFGPTGFGLKGIAERIQILGGTLKIDSALGQGTFIHIEIPL